MNKEYSQAALLSPELLKKNGKWVTCFSYMCVLICYTVTVNEYIFTCFFYKQTGNICLLDNSENLASDS